MNKKKIEDRFYKKIGRELYNTIFIIHQAGWSRGAQGIAIYTGESFISLWVKAFVLNEKKTEKRLIEKFYGGKKNFLRQSRIMIESLDE